MTPRSLRLRLLAAAAIAIFLALAAAWLAMGYLFARHVERRVEDDLIARGREIVAGLTPDAAGVLQAPDLSDSRFRTPASGLYWQIDSGNLVLRSRSLWDETLAAPQNLSASDWRRDRFEGPFEQDLLRVSRQVQLDPGAAPISVVLAEDYATVTESRDAFTRELALFLALLWAVLAAAAWIQVQLGLKPLNDVQTALGSLRRSPSARLKETDYPAEAAPLALAINALADARASDLEQARRRAGDLAHGLKTPLAAMAAQSRRAREAGAQDAADGLDKAIEAARQAVERELARSRAAASAGAGANGRLAAAKLIQVVERTEHGARVRIENLVSETPYRIGEDVWMEMAGPLLENAVRHAKGLVRMSGDGASLDGEDDGPGIAEADAEAALARGARLDEASDGHGLGLAIVKDLSEATGGELSLTGSSLGGLLARVRWPNSP
jgi:signal transduction histidine kinase